MIVKYCNNNNDNCSILGYVFNGNTFGKFVTENYKSVNYV